MNNEPSPKKRSVISLQRANNAWRGVVIFVKHDKGLDLFFSIIALCLGYILHISSTEWLFIILCIGLVLTAEAFNTAIEIHMDLTSPEYHPHARDTKDVAAGAVLITSVMAFVVGLIIFLPRILHLLR